VISVSKGLIQYVEHGVISAKPSLDFVSRLKIIGCEIAEIVKRFSPHVTVVEKIFLGKNADSAFKLGHIRGICLLEALKSESRVVEYAARSVKKGIAGSGAATKEQVQMMLYAVLNLNSGVLNSGLKTEMKVGMKVGMKARIQPIKPDMKINMNTDMKTDVKTDLKKDLKAGGFKVSNLDASDALALAYYHSRMIEFEERLQRQLPIQNAAQNGRLKKPSVKEIL
jgi:crossover junction endodeoxyribonuclease RuvC